MMRFWFVLFTMTEISQTTESFAFKTITKNIYLQHSNNFQLESKPTYSDNDNKKTPSKIEKNIKNNSPSLATEILFKTSENFGKLASLFSKSSSEASVATMTSTSSSSSLKSKRLNIDEMKNRLKEEYERIFWVTGNMDLSLWEDNCTFSDPFSYFGGINSLKRFKTNADNFARFVINPQSKIMNIQLLKKIPFNNNSNNSNNTSQKIYNTISYEDYGPTVDIVKISWSYSSRLNLPWKPVLAAAGETSHFISYKTGKIFLYEERWKSNKRDVIARLFTPGK